MRNIEKQYDLHGNEIELDNPVEQNPVKVLAHAYAELDKGKGIETAEEKQKRIHDTNKALVESGKASAFDLLRYGYGQIDSTKVNGLNPYEQRRKELRERNKAQLEKELEEHRKRFPEAFGLK